MSKRVVIALCIGIPITVIIALCLSSISKAQGRLSSSGNIVSKDFSFYASDFEILEQEIELGKQVAYEQGKEDGKKEIVTKGATAVYNYKGSYLRYTASQTGTYIVSIGGMQYGYTNFNIPNNLTKVAGQSSGNGSNDMVEYCYTYIGNIAEGEMIGISCNDPFCCFCVSILN